MVLGLLGRCGGCQVKLDERFSDSYHVERCVKQGSVLSPALFLLVMEPLLRQLQVSSVGLSINSFYAGGFSMLVILEL